MALSPDRDLETIHARGALSPMCKLPCILAAQRKNRNMGVSYETESPSDRSLSRHLYTGLAGLGVTDRFSGGRQIFVGVRLDLGKLFKKR